jgi:hypothetical protein
MLKKLFLLTFIVLAAGVNLVAEYANPPDIIISPTHPIQSVYYTTNTVTFQWSASTNAAGYFVSVDTNPVTVATSSEVYISYGYTTQLSTTITSVPEGINYFHVSPSTDSINPGLAASHYRVNIDTTPPGLVQINTFSAVSKEFGAILLQWAGTTDRTSGVANYKIYRTSSIAAGYSLVNTVSVTQFTDPGDGLLNKVTYYYYLRVVDNAGNEQSNVLSTMTAVCLKSADAPVITGADPQFSQSVWYNINGSAVYWRAVSAWTTGYYYLLDQNPASIPTASNNTGGLTYRTTAYLTLFYEGVWYFHIVSRDMAGNVSNIAGHYALRVDTTCPVPPYLMTSPTHPDQTQYYTASTATISWDEPQDVSGVVGYYISFTPQSPAMVTQLSGDKYTISRTTTVVFNEGTSYINVISSDYAGNAGLTYTSYKINVDTTPPGIIPGITATTLNSGRIYVTWDSVIDKTSGLAYYRVYRSSAGLTTGFKSVYITTLTYYTDDGAELQDRTGYYYHVCAVDNVGLEQPSQGPVATAYCLKTAVDVMISSVTPHADGTKWYRDTTATAFWQSPSQWTTGYYYLFDQNPASVPTASNNTGGLYFQTSLNLSITSQNVWYLHLVARDVAGNVSTIASHYKLNVDTSPPAAPSLITSQTHPDGTQYYPATTATVNWDEPQDVSGIAGYFVAVSTYPRMVTQVIAGNYVTSRTTTVYVSEGTSYINVISSDHAGNVGLTYTSYKINVDTTPPYMVTGLIASSRKSGVINLAWQPVSDVTTGISQYKLYRSSYYAAVNTSAYSLISAGIMTEYTDTGENLQDRTTYYYYVRAVDSINNEQSSGTIKPAFCLKTVNMPVINTVYPQSDQTKWYNVLTTTITWHSPGQWTIGYYYVFDQNPATVPTPDNNTSNGLYIRTTVYMTILGEGGALAPWYFHVIAEDYLGNVGTIANHYKINVATSPAKAPSVIVSPTHPDQSKYYTAQSVTVSWEEPADITGINGYSVSITTFPGPVRGVYTSSRSITVIISEGTRYINVMSSNSAGNSSITSVSYRVNIDTVPPAEIGTSTFTVTARDLGVVYLSWAGGVTDKTSGVAYYRVYRSSYSSITGFMLAGTVVATEFTDTAAELVTQTVYYYKTCAVDNAGNEQPNNPIKSAVCLKTVDTPVILSVYPQSDQSKWYSVTKTTISWQILSGWTAGYYYVLDKNPATIPTSENNTSGGLYNKTTVQLTLPGEGVWYFHIVSKDVAGNVSSYANHYTIRSDTTPPNPPQILISNSHPVQTEYYTNRNPSFSWNVPPDLSGIAGFYYMIDAVDTNFPDPGSAAYTDWTTVTTSNVPYGLWYFHVIARDSAGNVSTVQKTFTVHVAEGSLPSVTGLSQVYGYNTSFTTITIYGDNFTWIESVTLDDPAVTQLVNIIHLSTGMIKATVPPGVLIGEYNVRVTNPAGTNTYSSFKFRVLVKNTDSATTRCVADPLTSVYIPVGTFNTAVSVIISTTPADIGLVTRANNKVVSGGMIQILPQFSTKIREITPMNESGFLGVMYPNKTVSITMSYPDVGPNINPAQVRIIYINTNTEQWELVSGSQTVNTSNKTVTVETEHFSTFGFGIIQSAVSNMSTVLVYPNPYNPKTTVHGTVKFINLTNNPTLKIYNITGELVVTVSPGTQRGNTVNITGSGKIEWDGTNETGSLVSDGTYIYVITDPAGNKVAGKLGVIQ